MIQMLPKAYHPVERILRVSCHSTATPTASPEGRLYDALSPPNPFAATFIPATTSAHRQRLLAGEMALC